MKSSGWILISLLLRSVDGGHRGDHGVDATLVTDVGAPTDLVVPILSPVFAPGVLDDPVGLLLQADGGKASCTIADKENTVVKVLATDVGA